MDTNTKPPIDRAIYPYGNPHGYPHRSEAEIVAALKADNQTLEECGCCGEWHRSEWYGDCREDSERFDYGVAELAEAEGLRTITTEEQEEQHAKEDAPPNAHARRIARRLAEREQAQAITHAAKSPKQSDARAILKADWNQRQAGA